MIWDSWPWKREIANRANALKRRKAQFHWSEVSLANVEKDIFLSAYAVRKLLDAKMISDEVENCFIPTTSYPSQGRGVDLMNWHKVDKLFKLTKCSKISVGLRDYCNLIIHSFVFSLCFGSAGALEGFFVSSDREKNSRLFFFNIDSIMKVLYLVANDDIVYASWSRDASGKSIKIVKKSNRVRSR